MQIEQAGQRLFSKETIPWAMAAGRAALGPLLMMGAACRWNGVALAMMVLVALVSDIFDGVLARRWKCDTAGVRLLDSMADTFFYLCVGCALWLVDSEIWRRDALLLGAVLGLEVIRSAHDFAKYGKPASYHSYLAKGWGLVLAIAVMAEFWTGGPVGLMRAALWVGVACLSEGIAMSLMLPMWSKDVKTLRAAWLRRCEWVRKENLMHPSGGTQASTAWRPPAGGASRSSGRTGAPLSWARSSSFEVRAK